MYRATRHLRGLAGILLFGLTLASTGCVPGVAWLPDSSGFICTAGKDYSKLIHYDLGKGEEHVLVEDTGAPTDWPAVSPDGKRLAVAKLVVTPGLKQTTLQVILYDRAGKELKRSKVFDWLEMENPAPAKKPPGRSGQPGLPQLFWAPAGDKIIVHSPGYTAIYEIKMDRVIHAGDGQLLIFGGTPIRPDGAGFLIMKNAQHWFGWWDKSNKKGDPNPGFTFVDWNGKERSLTPPPLLGDAAAMRAEKDGNKLIGLLCPALYDSGWEGDTAQVSWNVDRLRYLTGRGKAVLERVKPEKIDGLLVRQRYDFPGDRARLRVVMTRWNDQKPDAESPVRIEFLKAGQNKPQVIVEQAGSCVLIPAPNRKLLALRIFPGKKSRESEMVMVVNDQGEVAARVQTDR